MKCEYHGCKRKRVCFHYCVRHHEQICMKGLFPDHRAAGRRNMELLAAAVAKPGASGAMVLRRRRVGRIRAKICLSGQWIDFYWYWRKREGDDDWSDCICSSDFPPAAAGRLREILKRADKTYRSDDGSWRWFVFLEKEGADAGAGV